MRKKEFYLDYNSTTPIDPRVKEKYLEYLDIFGNPSNIYRYGRDAKKLLETARKKVAQFFGVTKDEIVFTSGGTMSNNIALFGLAKTYGGKKKHILCSMVEHPSCLNTVRQLSNMGFSVTYLPVDVDGVVRLDLLEKSIKNDTFLIVSMAVNNETGSIQPVDGISEIAKKYNLLFHCDAVQAIGKTSFDLGKLNISTLSASAHKFYGPKGVGFLYINKNVNVAPILFGGHQERALFPGTENLVSILALADALEIAYAEIQEETKKEKEIKKMIYDGLKEIYSPIKLNGSFEKTVHNTLNISFIGKINTEIADRLDNLGVYVGTGSACKTGSDEPSYVLLAMGLSKKEYQGAIRLSIGRFTKKDDVAEIIKRFKEALS